MEVDGQAEEGHIRLKVIYPRVPNLTYNFRINISVASQDINGNNAGLFSKTLFTPETKISLGPFEGGKIYKVACTSNIAGQEYVKTIFVFVGSWGEESQQAQSQSHQQVPILRPRSEHQPHRNAIVQPVRQAKQSAAFSNSQDLMKMVGKSVGITNEKTLDRFILKGRNCRNAKEFVGRANSDCLKKQQMLVKGKLILNDVYKQREGMQFFKNDWFMGPFYSYDHNEKKMAE